MTEAWNSIPSSSKSDGVHVQGSGKIDGTPSGGLTLDLTLDAKEPFSEVRDDADQHFFFLPGLINLPDSAGPITITTEFTSVSSRPDADLPIVRKTTQEITIANPDATKANLRQITPQFPLPGELMTLLGTNLGENPVVHFPTTAGGTIQVEAGLDGAGNLVAPVPSGVVDGPIQIDNGTGVGNNYRVKILFSPVFRAGLGAAETPQSAIQGAEGGGDFFFLFQQPPEQFVLSELRVRIPGADMALSELSTGDGENIVGSGRMKLGFNQTNFDLKVLALEENAAELQLVDAGGVSLEIKIRVERQVAEDEATELLFWYRPDDAQEEPALLDDRSSLELQINFRALPVQFPQGDIPVTGIARMTSTPTGVGGADATLETQQIVAFE